MNIHITPFSVFIQPD